MYLKKTSVKLTTLLVDIWKHEEWNTIFKKLNKLQLQKKKNVRTDIRVLSIFTAYWYQYDYNWTTVQIRIL